MVLNDTTISKSSFKLLQGRAHTSNAFDLQNEGEPSSANFGAQEIFSKEIPFNPGEAINNNIAVFIQLDLVLDIGSAGKSYQAQIATVAGSVLDGYINPRTGLAYADGDRVGFFIPPKFDEPPPPPPAPAPPSYRAILRDGGVEIAPSSPENWFFDYRAGIVTSETNLSLTTGTIEGWVYVESFVAGDLADLFNSALWEPTGGTDIVNTNIGDVLYKNNFYPSVDLGGTIGSTLARPLRVYSGPLGFVSYSSAAETGTARTWISQIDTVTNPGNFYIREAASAIDYITFQAGTSNIGIGTDTPNEILTAQGALSLRETGTPSPTANYGKFYVNIVNGNPHFLRDDGTDFELIGGGGGGGGGGGDGYWTTNIGDTVNIYNSTFGKVGIADNEYRDDAQLSVTRITTNTSGILPVQNIKIKSTGATSAGFGGSIYFRLEDSSATDNVLARISAYKGSASDDDGELSFTVADAGVPFSKLTLNNEANLTLQYSFAFSTIVPTFTMANADSSIAASQVLGKINFTSADSSLTAADERAYVQAVSRDTNASTDLHFGLSASQTTPAGTKMTLRNDAVANDTTSLFLNTINQGAGSSEIVFQEGQASDLNGMKWKYDGFNNRIELYGFQAGYTSTVAGGPWFAANRHNGDVLIRRYTPATSSDEAALTIRLVTTGDMVDGFGPNLNFQVTDSTLIGQTYGRISAIRSDGSDSSGSLQLKTFNAGVENTTMHLSFDGKVGINRTAPTYDLEVSNPNPATGSTLALRLADSDIITGDVLGNIRWIGLDEGGERTGARIWAEAYGTWNNGGTWPRAISLMKFSVEDNGNGTLSNSPRMIISDRGVVVGNAINEPDAGVWNNPTLHVIAASAGTVTAHSSTKLTLEDSANTYLSFLTPSSSESGLMFGDTGSSEQAGIIYLHGDDEMQFRLGGSADTTGSAKMTITNSGSVGIGTIDPIAKLHIEGTATGSSFLANGILLEATDTITDAEIGIAFQSRGPNGTGSNRWLFGMNEGNAHGLGWYYGTGSPTESNRRMFLDIDPVEGTTFLEIDSEEQAITNPTTHDVLRLRRRINDKNTGDAIGISMDIVDDNNNTTLPLGEIQIAIENGATTAGEKSSRFKFITTNDNVRNEGVQIGPTGILEVSTSIEVDSITLNGTSISSTGSLSLLSTGTGDIDLDSDDNVFIRAGPDDDILFFESTSNEIARFDGSAEGLAIGIGACQTNRLDVRGSQTGSTNPGDYITQIVNVETTQTQHYLLKLAFAESSTETGTGGDLFLDCFSNDTGAGGGTREFYIDGQGGTGTSLTIQHWCVYKAGVGVADFEDEIQPGMIVESTGEKGINRGIETAIPVVKISDTANSKKVFGVLSSDWDYKNMAHWIHFNGTYNDLSRREELFVNGSYDPNGNDVCTYSPSSQYFKARSNSGGEGKIWVTNIDGEIQNGDYITSSEVPGYGALQADDLLHSYTVAKCTIDVDWASITDTIEHEGSTYKKALVFCTYHCG